MAHQPPLHTREPRRFVRLTSSDREARSALARRELVRVTRGIAVPAPVWAALDHDGRRWIRIEAVLAAVGNTQVVSHGSAGAYWGLPSLVRDDRVHVTDPGLIRTRTSRLLVRHAAPLAPDDIVDAGGLRVTSLRRTWVDIARSSDFEQAVVLFDHLLHERLATADELRAALEAWGTRYGIARALEALAFADGGSESVGESRSRVVFLRVGLPAPQLQHVFRTDRGAFRVDFWWPEHGVVGEFDGQIKFTGPGASPETLFAEKRREDAIRRVDGVRGVARWTWDDLDAPGEVERILRVAGLAVLGAHFR